LASNRCGDPQCPVCSNPEYEAPLLQAADMHIAGLARHGKLSGVSVDVGAHVGLWARSLARSYWRCRRSPGTILAFEPDGDTCARMISGCPGNVILLNVAAWSTNTGTLSLVGTGPRAYVSETARDGTPVDGKTVDSVVYDSYGGVVGVDVLKIDAEGAEYEVLFGARSVLKKSTDLLVLVEICDRHLERFNRTREDIVRLLRSHGYSPLREPRTGPDAVDKIFFMRKAR